METSFHKLSMDRVLTLAERALGERCTSLCRPLNSYINRVYELEREEGDPIIVKFYRPGRWSEGALLDEHDFLFDLAAADVPVIPPWLSAEGDSLFDEAGLFYALFPKKWGRIVDEPTGEQWAELGRLVARMHLVGEEDEAEDRIEFTPQAATSDHIDFMLETDLVTPGLRSSWEDTCWALVDELAPRFADTTLLRIHGDLHPQNLIFRPGESYYLIDFDDMAMGPAVQDLWMLLPGRAADCPTELAAFIDGYERFRAFDHYDLQLIEPLRAMRYIHFSAWCACQAAAGGYHKLDPDWGSEAHWRREIADLQRQHHSILNPQL